jgi:hypothetical protein
MPYGQSLHAVHCAKHKQNEGSTELGVPSILSIKLSLPLLLQPLLLLHKGLHVVPGSHLLSLAGCCLPPVLFFNACYHSIHLSPLSSKLLLQDLRLMTKYSIFEAACNQQLHQRLVLLLLLQPGTHAAPAAGY